MADPLFAFNDAFIDAASMGGSVGLWERIDDAMTVIEDEFRKELGAEYDIEWVSGEQLAINLTEEQYEAEFGTPTRSPEATVRKGVARAAPAAGRKASAVWSA